MILLLCIVVAPFGDVLLSVVVTPFDDKMLLCVVTPFDDSILFWFVTSFDVAGGIVVGLTTLDPLLLQNLPKNLHVLHDPGPGTFFSDKRH